MGKVPGSPHHPWLPMILNWRAPVTGPLGPPLSDAPDIHIYTVLFSYIQAYLRYTVQSCTNISSNEVYK